MEFKNLEGKTTLTFIDGETRFMREYELLLDLKKGDTIYYTNLSKYLTRHYELMKSG